MTVAPLIVAAGGVLVGLVLGGLAGYRAGHTRGVADADEWWTRRQ